MYQQDPAKRQISLSSKRQSNLIIAVPTEGTVLVDGKAIPFDSNNDYQTRSVVLNMNIFQETLENISDSGKNETLGRTDHLSQENLKEVIRVPTAM